MRFALLAVVLVAGLASAQSDDCRAVQRALHLAQSADVDTGSLWRLEKRLCSPAPSTSGGATCEQLDAFWMLAMATGADASVSGTLEAQRGVWCGRSDEPQRQLQWSNGNTLRSSSGTLYWPNGTIARSTSGAWYVSSGTLVKSTSGSLSYPSGTLFRSTSGRYSLTSGEFADEGRIVALACESDRGWCRYFLNEANVSTGTRRDFALLGLALLAGRD